MKKKSSIKKSSGNIFKDLALPQPERLLIRAKVMLCAAEVIRKRGLTQKEASEVLRIPQSKVSCLMNGKLSMFSLDHLFEILHALDQSVEIVIKPSNGELNVPPITLAA